MKKGQGHIALLGATGIWGKQLTEALCAKGFPSERLTLVASKHSEGEEVSYGDDSLWVEAMTPAVLKGAKLAILALPREVAAQAVAWAEQAGLRILDASGGSLPKVPLISPHALGEAEPQWPRSERHLVLASPLAHALACLLFPLGPLGRVEATAICGAACLGKAGVKALEKQTLAMLSGREEEAEAGKRQAFNILPAFEGGEGGGFASHAEAEVAAEVSRLLGSPLVLGLHVFLAPFFFGVTVSFAVAVEGGKGLGHWREALALGHGIKVLEDKHGLCPMPMLVSQDASLLLGKLRMEGNVLRGVFAFEPANRMAAFAANLAMAGVGA
jgi:aspartate-semialdehyde dehydrogenase